MQGGVLFYKSVRASTDQKDECFADFMRGATVRKVNDGTYGVVFQCTTANAAKTCYVDPVRKRPVTTLLVKLCALAPQETVGVIAGKRVRSVTRGEFMREAQVQASLYVDTMMRFGRPVCPALVYAAAMSPADVAALLRVEVSRDAGVIAMEIVEGARTVYSLGEPPKLLRQFRRLLLMAGEMGVAHGDFHSDNLLVDGSGEPYLIDFGNATRMSVLETERVRAATAAADARAVSRGRPGSYEEAIRRVAAYGFARDYAFDRKYGPQYAWIYVDDVAPPFVKLEMDVRWLRRAPTDVGSSRADRHSPETSAMDTELS